MEGWGGELGVAEVREVRGEVMRCCGLKGMQVLLVLVLVLCSLRCWTGGCFVTSLAPARAFPEEGSETDRTTHLTNQ